MVKVNETLLREVSQRCVPVRPARRRFRNGRIKSDITIQYVPNVLDKKGHKRVSLPYDRDWTVGKYLRKANIDHKDMAVSVNGNKGDLNDRLTIGDEIVVYPRIAGGITQIFTWVMAISNIAMLGYSIYSAVTAKKPSFNTSGSSIDSDSAANAWDGVHTTSRAGGP
ncbi:MAG: hypothetical protein WC301_07690, partial [Candidatus Omnitrophota bacterium]